MYTYDVVTTFFLFLHLPRQPRSQTSLLTFCFLKFLLCLYTFSAIASHHIIRRHLVLCTAFFLQRAFYSSLSFRFPFLSLFLFCLSVYLRVWDKWGFLFATVINLVYLLSFVLHCFTTPRCVPCSLHFGMEGTGLIIFPLFAFVFRLLSLGVYTGYFTMLYYTVLYCTILYYHHHLSFRFCFKYLPSTEAITRLRLLIVS